jgi:hypothetical protein
VTANLFLKSTEVVVPARHINPLISLDGGLLSHHHLFSFGATKFEVSA